MRICRVRLLTSESPLEEVWRAFLISLCSDESVYSTEGNLFTSTEYVFRIQAKAGGRRQIAI